MFPQLHIPRMILPSDLFWEYNIELEAMGFFFISMVSYQKGPTRHAYAWQDTLDSLCSTGQGCFSLYDWLSLQYFGPWINRLFIVYRSIHGKSSLNNLVCKFRRMDNSFYPKTVFGISLL